MKKIILAFIVVCLFSPAVIAVLTEEQYDTILELIEHLEQNNDEKYTEDLKDIIANLREITDKETDSGRIQRLNNAIQNLEGTSTDQQSTPEQEGITIPLIPVFIILIILIGLFLKRKKISAKIKEHKKRKSLKITTELLSTRIHTLHHAKLNAQSRLFHFKHFNISHAREQYEELFDEIGFRKVNLKDTVIEVITTHNNHEEFNTFVNKYTELDPHKKSLLEKIHAHLITQEHFDVHQMTDTFLNEIIKSIALDCKDAFLQSMAELKENHEEFVQEIKKLSLFEPEKQPSYVKDLSAAKTWEDINNLKIQERVQEEKSKDPSNNGNNQIHIINALAVKEQEVFEEMKEIREQISLADHHIWTHGEEKISFLLGVLRLDEILIDLLQKELEFKHSTLNL